MQYKRMSKIFEMLMVLFNRSDITLPPEPSPSVDHELSKEEEELLEGLAEPLKEEAMEGGFLVSSTKGEGLVELQLKIQDQVLKATRQKFFKITVPADGPQLRYDVIRLRHDVSLSCY